MDPSSSIPQPKETSSCWESTKRWGGGIFMAAAVAAMAIGILSLLSEYHVLSDSWNIINEKTWSYITEISGFVVAVSLIACYRLCGKEDAKGAAGGGSGSGWFGWGGGAASGGSGGPTPSANGNPRPADAIIL